MPNDKSVLNFVVQCRGSLGRLVQVTKPRPLGFTCDMPGSNI